MADPVAFTPQGSSRLVSRKALTAWCRTAALALEALRDLGHRMVAKFLDIAGQVLHLRAQLRNAPETDLEIPGQPSLS